MARIIDILVKATAVVVGIISLASCDPWCNYEVYLKNTTSQTITFYAIPKSAPDTDSDSLGYYHYFEEKYSNRTLKQGEKALLIKNSDMGTISSEDLPWIMEVAYPNGIVIKYENGDSIIYHPSGVDTDFHSPYNRNSFFSIDKTDEVLISEYDVLY